MPIPKRSEDPDLTPYDDPHWMGGIGMMGTKAAYTAVMNIQSREKDRTWTGRNTGSRSYMRENWT